MEKSSRNTVITIFHNTLHPHIFLARKWGQAGLDNQETSPPSHLSYKRLPASHPQAVRTQYEVQGAD